MSLHVHLTTTTDAAAVSTRRVRAAARTRRGARPFDRKREAYLKLFALNSDPTMFFTYNPELTDRGTKIVFIQVVRCFKDGQLVWPGQYSDQYHFKNRDTTALGYFVDGEPDEDDPYYNGDDDADDGQQGDAHTLQPATMHDTPMLGAINFVDGTLKAKAEFRTASFSADGADRGTYYEYRDWTFEKEKGGRSNLTLGLSGIDPGQDFKDAVDLWCKNHRFPLPKPVPPAPPPAGPYPYGRTTYVVKLGDTLPQIAQAFYGNSNQWPRIYQANVAVIGPNPNLLFPGKTLVIPDLNYYSPGP
jgi:hypothetical protein